MSIQEQLKDYIGTELASNADGLDFETNLQDVIDSTAVMELVVWIEDNYGFQVDLDDIEPEQFGTINKLAAYIEARKQG